MWSGPRNISTTLMYSFAQRSDTKVFDEPLYAYYLKNTKSNLIHPGDAEVLKSQENDGRKVIDQMLSNEDALVLFFKQMTHHLLNLERDFLKQTINILLTRNPVEMLPSFDAVIENPKLEDVGYKQHVDLVNYFTKEEIQCIVLDSTKVLLNPKEQLTMLCDKLGIPFEESMLHWEKGARKEDGIWAKYWYKNIHNSTGFKEYEPKEIAFPENLKPLLAECQPYYERLKGLAL